MGIERATFLIDADGTVTKVWRKVKVAGHVEKVLEAVQALNAERKLAPLGRCRNIVLLNGAQSALSRRWCSRSP